jgi:hypothetical protein
VVSAEHDGGTMKPVSFKHSTATLQPSDKEYSDDIEGVEALPIWTNGEQCVSCWRANWRERLSILLFGKVWVSVLSGDTQPPVCVMSENPFVEPQGGEHG